MTDFCERKREATQRNTWGDCWVWFCREGTRRSPFHPNKWKTGQTEKWTTLLEPTWKGGAQGNPLPPDQETGQDLELCRDPGVNLTQEPSGWETCPASDEPQGGLSVDRSDSQRLQGFPNPCVCGGVWGAGSHNITGFTSRSWTTLPQRISEKDSPCASSGEGEKPLWDTSNLSMLNQPRPQGS